MPLYGVVQFSERNSGRAVLYISQALRSDSGFPFRHGDNLIGRIDKVDQSMVIRKADEAAMLEAKHWKDLAAVFDAGGDNRNAKEATVDEASR